MRVIDVNGWGSDDFQDEWAEPPRDARARRPNAPNISYPPEENGIDYLLSVVEHLEII